MCKCTQTDGYVQAMQNAISLEKKTGNEQAVFTKNGISYFGNREAVAKEKGICCYILTTGEEIQIAAEKKTTAKAKPEAAEPKEAKSESSAKEEKDDSKK